MTKLALPAAMWLPIIGACSVPPSDGRYSQQYLPDAATFPRVAELLDVRCGSLDCHGNIHRNLRLYGSAGLRWSPSDQPFQPPCDTSEEVGHDYASVIGLEPETMSAVVQAGGADPQRLTVVRKARGAEAHKGGTIWTAGDDADTCLTSWLAGNVNEPACSKGLSDVLPIGPLNPLLSCVAK